ncbi:protein SMAX1-LIKE 4 [Phalaenopsis equestris]|uniref:protein SMAX1-LIKE 4 n=1 Tax=Phalaenopsis equestris TaxID=78828 RepID=UPI0009E430AD|nr:protein SMAX1-LIKE 4 [Phalaenopsis equestris]
MRAGACTIQQALTAEAASILKHSLNLARRRGHAQVTPLHVAATLLNSSYSASSLLRRACIRSHPQHPTSLPLQCRALELCFNVALNRLPTSPPPSSSSSLLHSHPSLSNALIAALKRAQAHQRRGCIESQNQHSHQTQQQNNQPLLAIKVELEQLIISILDDPSVSRVMREAGFSSISVKQNLEEDSSSGFGLAVSTQSQSLVFDNSSVFLPTHLMKTVEKKEDVRLVLEVMMRRKQRCGNAVVVGDSGSIAEGVMDELLQRLDRGEVPEELRGAQVIKLQLSYVHLRLLSKVDVEMKISDLRRRVLSSLEKGVVVYAGDLRWAVGDDGRAWESLAGFRPVEYLISEVGRLLSEIKNGLNGVGGERGRVWVLAFSSYKTYMRCKLIKPLLESQWDLQAVLVPSGGLALSLQAPCSMDSVVSKLKQYHLQMLDPRDSNAEEEEEKFLCCAECFTNYEKEVASVLKSEAKDAITGNTKLPCWLQSQIPEKPHKTNFLELRKKWKRLCQNLHQSRISIAQAHPSFISKAYASSHPWPSNSLPSTNSLLSIEPSSMSFPAHSKRSPKQWPSESNPKSSKKLIMTTLALCNHLCSDSATSNDHIKPSPVSPRGLTQKIQENIPWQSEHIHLVVDALLDCRSSEKKETCIVIHGNDRIAKKRLVRLVADSFFGSTESVLHINMKRSTGAAIDLIKAALVKEPKAVVLIDDIDCTAPEFVKLIQNGIKDGYFKDSCGRKVGLPSLMFILTSSASKETEPVEGDGCDKVIRMRMWTDGEEEHQQQSNEKRKSEWNQTREKKQPRTSDGDELDLNVAITSNDDGNDDCGLSDLTNDASQVGNEVQLPAKTVLNFDINTDVFGKIVERFTVRLQRAFEEVVAGNREKETLVVDPALAEELATASGYFLEFEFDKWVREVFQNCIPTVKKGGKVRLGMEGRVENRLELGFLGSTLPMKISVD